MNIAVRRALDLRQYSRVSSKVPMSKLVIHLAFLVKVNMQSIVLRIELVKIPEIMICVAEHILVYGLQKFMKRKLK